ncbi:MAG: DUF3566 domain-containing protein, partial [Actinomycetota bacterium]
MTIKRLDPWSMLKFGAVVSVVTFAIAMLVAGVIWFIIDRLQLVDQICGIAIDVGFTSCGVESGNVFRALALLGGMGVIVLTAVLVFSAFLYNLIADLTGGLTVGVIEEAVVPARSSVSSHQSPRRDDPARQNAVRTPSPGPSRAIDDTREQTDRPTARTARPP